MKLTTLQSSTDPFPIWRSSKQWRVIMLLQAQRRVLDCHRPCVPTASIAVAVAVTIAAAVQVVPLSTDLNLAVGVVAEATMACANKAAAGFLVFPDAHH